MSEDDATPVADAKIEHASGEHAQHKGGNLHSRPEYQTSDPPANVRLPPPSRFRRRSDGGVDDTYRVHFVGRLEPAELRDVIDALLVGVDEGAELGIIGLTKLEFIEPDICEYRLYCADFRSARLNKEFQLLARINQIHEIHDVDGLHYSLLGPSLKDEEEGTLL